MNTSSEEGIDATSVDTVLAVIIAIVLITVAALVLRKRGKSAT